jgi:hypothetical protein
MAIKIYAHHTINKWKSRNKYFISELKHRYKAEKHARKAEKAHRLQDSREREELEEAAAATMRVKESSGISDRDEASSF